MTQPLTRLEQRLRSLALPLEDPFQLEPLLQRVGDARFVLLGEASHGTSEYYTWRTAITQRLIAEQGFTVVAVEGDWPDCQRIHRYLREGGPGARDVLERFERWPTWMWANREVETLVGWMRQWSEAHAPLSFYGLDVYSLWDSLAHVLDYLREHDPELLPTALEAFRCFDVSGGDAEVYAWRTRLHDTCELEVTKLLSGMLQRRKAADGDRFDAEQNALVVHNAERYYRIMMRGGPDSWNLRDEHMTETLDRIVQHHGPDTRVVVWEHNTHVGDARFTDMAAAGMVNVGQLVRERYGQDAVKIVGFGSYEGSVIAASSWEAPMQEMPVPPARRGSWEELMHRALGGDHLLILEDEDDEEMLRPRGHRAIGVVYDPRHEAGNYVPTVLPRRYDAFIYLDRTTALHPLQRVEPIEELEFPETWPTGM